MCDIKCQGDYNEDSFPHLNTYSFYFCLHCYLGRVRGTEGEKQTNKFRLCSSSHETWKTVRKRLHRTQVKHFTQSISGYISWIYKSQCYITFWLYTYARDLFRLLHKYCVIECIYCYMQSRLKSQKSVHGKTQSVRTVSWRNLFFISAFCQILSTPKRFLVWSVTTIY